MQNEHSADSKADLSEAVQREDGRNLKTAQLTAEGTLVVVTGPNPRARMIQ